MNNFDRSLYQVEKKWKHKLTPFDISKNNSDRVVNLFIYKSH